MIERVGKVKPLQTFLEGFYTMQEDQQSALLVCLSDLATFHILQVVKGSESPLLKVVQAFTCFTSVDVADYTNVLHTLAECLLVAFNEVSP